MHFRNIELRDPGEGGVDKKILMYIRRANLGAFWARRPGTVYHHFLEIRSIIEEADDTTISRTRTCGFKRHIWNGATVLL